MPLPIPVRWPKSRGGLDLRPLDRAEEIKWCARKLSDKIEYIRATRTYDQAVLAAEWGVKPKAWHKI